ncbi:MAG: hypothetical protein ACRD51_12340 [Candidatus Acidiferrum sp.]
MHRKEYALELYRQGLAPRVLLSVGRFEIRRFSKMSLPVPLDLLEIAQQVSPPQRHYFVYFHKHDVAASHIQPGRFGTLTEIASLGRWLRSHPEVRSLLIISSDTHLRRIRLCSRLLLDPALEMTFAPAPEPPAESTASFHLASMADDLLELFKLSFYWILLKAR